MPSSIIFEPIPLERAVADLLSFFGKQPGPELKTAMPNFALSQPDAMRPAERAQGEALQALKFRYPLRQYQKEIIELIHLKLERGESRLHIVAPPGAGKTIMGLQLISELKQPSLIVCPTTTIQAQWGQKLELFVPANCTARFEDLLGTHEDRPLKPITLLTYQVLTTTANEHDYLAKLAHQSWSKEIVAATALSQGDAELRIIELMQNNRKSYERELSRHISHLRRKFSDVIDPKEILHPNAIALLQALRRQKFKTVIFDECHHLTDYWAAVMKHAIDYLEDPLVIGLTGTPPEGKSTSQAKRYISLVGEIDYQVPTQALVRDGGLAPFQDLVLFTEPTDKERTFLDGQHEEFHHLIDELSTLQPPLLQRWIHKRLFEDSPRRESYLSKRPDLKGAMLRFAWKYKLELPLSLSEGAGQSLPIDDWMIILEDFALNFLKVSASSDNHALYEKIRSAIGKLGFGLTERGVRKQASPVDRVLAFSRSKSSAVATILEHEYANLGDKLRVAVITDFEKMSATSAKTVKGVLTQESGGAAAVLQELLMKPIGQSINPCLVTGSLLLVDRRIASQFIETAKEYLRKEGLSLDPQIQECTSRHKSTDDLPAGSNCDVETSRATVDGNFEETIDFDPGAPEADWSEREICPAIDLPEPALDQIEPYVQITASGANWEARTYVAMATALLERGITKCLIGTRGIFGEGWDCQSLNTLVDLTTTTTPTSVKQLRGRSIRLKVDDPLGRRKVANNWDVVCVAPQLEKGLNDYQRFVRKHEGFFGISDDGQIECGVGHVHPAFSELTAAEVFERYEEYNNEMIQRALRRDQVHDLWKIDLPYKNRTLGCIEISQLRTLALTPPNLKRDLTYEEHAQFMRDNLNGLWLEYGSLGVSLSIFSLWLLRHFGAPLACALVPLATVSVLGCLRYANLYARQKADTCRPNTQESSLIDMAVALLCALQHMKLLPRYIKREAIKVSQRSDGSLRIFLDEADEQHADCFGKSLKELLSPITDQPYVVPKYEFFFPREEAVDRQQLDCKTTAPSGSIGEQPLVLSTPIFDDRAQTTHADFKNEAAFFKAYLQGKAQPRAAAYHAVPTLLSRSEKGRAVFQSAWNKYVSPGSIVDTKADSQLPGKYFGVGPSLAQRFLWE